MKITYTAESKGEEYAAPSVDLNPPAPVISAPVVVKQEPVPTIEEDSPVTDTAPAPALVAMPNEDTTQVVVDVVVDHTGYPADFVELDQDLEGELGIDTVKQAEIMADIRQVWVAC